MMARRNGRPKWLDEMRDALTRRGSAWLIYAEKGPVPRYHLNGHTEGFVVIGWYTQRVSDEQLLEDVAHARADAAIRGRGRPRGT